jgi:multidrug resistance efflux pump
VSVARFVSRDRLSRENEEELRIRIRTVAFSATNGMNEPLVSDRTGPRRGSGQVLLPLLLLPALLFGCRERQNVATAEDTALEIKAEISKPRSALVVASNDGRVTALPAEGSVVKAGELLTTLENPGVQRDLAYSRTLVALAERRVQLASTPRRPEAPDAGGAERIRVAEAIVAHRKERLQRLETLYATRDVTRDELQNARLELAAATRDLNAERRLMSSPQAQAADPTLLRLDLDRARAEAAVVADRQTHLQVIAPIGGIVTRVVAGPGSSVYARDPILEISDLSTLEVRGTVSPELLRYVKTGMAVDVKIFSVPPRRFRAPIRSVLPPADASGAAITVAVPNPDGMLQPGTAATITVR